MPTVLAWVAVFLNFLDSILSTIDNSKIFNFGLGGLLWEYEQIYRLREYSRTNTSKLACRTSIISTWSFGRSWRRFSDDLHFKHDRCTAVISKWRTANGPPAQFLRIANKYIRFKLAKTKLRRSAGYLQSASTNLCTFPASNQCVIIWQTCNSLSTCYMTWNLILKLN